MIAEKNIIVDGVVYLKGEEIPDKDKQEENFVESELPDVQRRAKKNS